MNNTADRIAISKTTSPCQPAIGETKSQPSSVLTTLRKKLSKPLLVLAAIALGGCTGGGQSPRTLAVGDIGEVYVQPIRVCDDNGNNCAGLNLFEDITAKILAQAQLKVSFLPANQLNATRYLSINSGVNMSNAESEFYQLTRTGGAGAFGRHPSSTQTSGPINVWFVDTLEAASGFIQFGRAWINGNGVVISGATLSFNNGNGRVDTVAHEIGHNLGLSHASSGGDRKNLLTEGSSRIVPSSVNDITPDGAGLAVLNASQIQTIRSSGLVNPPSADAIAATSTVSADQTRFKTLRQTAQVAAAHASSASLSPSSLRLGVFSQTTSPTTEPEPIPEPSSSGALWALSGLFLFSLARRLSTHDAASDSLSDAA